VTVNTFTLLHLKLNLKWIGSCDTKDWRNGCYVQATTCTTLRWMGYNSRRPHRVPLISSTKRKKRLQFARAHQNWTVEDFKNVV